MKVRNAMHPGVEWVSPSTTVKELARLMREHDIGALPVGENDRLVGMVTDRDLVCRALAEGCNPDKVTAREIMTKGITYCLDNEELGDAIRIMEQKQIRRLPVINGKKDGRHSQPRRHHCCPARTLRRGHERGRGASSLTIDRC